MEMDHSHSEATTIPYLHRLDASRQEIRIILLHPGLKADPVCCTLQTVSLEDKPKYTALSYVWGDPKATKMILVDGNLFPVTTNLEAALRHIRKVSSGREMWIDAICINQADMEERIQQVQLMRELYTEASEVIIWLGEGTVGSDMLADVLIHTGLPSEPNPSSPEQSTLLREYAVEMIKI